MARTGKWPARIALAVSAAMIATLFTVINASGQSSTEALLTVGKDVQSGSVTQATYSIVVRNQGNGASTNVRVRDVVPTNTTFESSNPAPSATTTSPGAPSCDNQGTREDPGTECEWNVGNLAPGETREILATFNLNQADVASYTVTNDVTAVDNEGHEAEDSDASLKRDRLTITDDTWVADAEPANTNHGACTHLRVQQNNSTTSFIDTDSLPGANAIDRLFGAQLRAQVDSTSYSQATPGVVGAHRITQQTDWTEGSGSCQGGTGSGTDARTGAEPTSAPGATGTAQITGFPQIVNWDVSADLDTANERGTFQGWELRDQASSGNDNFTRFFSSETGNAAEQPKLFIVYAAPEAATCIDADPDDDTNPFGTEHVMSAFVTDGDKVTSTTGGDACTGGPAATEVEWEVEDEANSDIYFSSQEGVPTSKTVDNGDAKPDSITTTSDDNGTTFAGIRQDEPVAGQNRIEVRLASATDDPDPPPTFPAPPATCGQPPVFPDPCPTENATHDDVIKNWNASGSSGSSGTGGTTSSTSSSTSPSGSASPSGSQSSGPSPSGSQSSTSPSASSSSSRPPSGSSSSTSSPPQSARTISLFASSNEVVFPAQVTLSGTISSADNDCDDADEFVRIERRILGQSSYEQFENEATNADGRFELSFPATQSAEYVAIAPRHDECADASSSPQTVTVKVKVTARSSRRSVERGRSVRITGQVQPDHDGTDVLLQRRKGGRWVTIASDELDSRSRYRFVVEAKWRGRRTFRTLWRAQDEEHETNNSRRVVVRTTRPS